MREIKFRSWDNYNQVMSYSCQYPNLGAFFDYVGRIDLSAGFALMQYTGLKDKNGKEIYEGDIVRYQCNSAGYEINKEFATREVSFGRGAFSCKETHSMLWACGNGCTTDGQLNDVEVIGNIYENKELLE